MSGRRGAWIALLALALAAASCGAFGMLGRARARQESRIASLEALAASLKAESVPLRFMIISRDSGRLAARIRLYDLAGAEVGLVEAELPGKELYLDFLVSPLAGEGARWLAFPYRVFTDSVAAAGGIDLLAAYDRTGFPAVFESGGLGAPERARLARVFSHARASAAGAKPPAAGSKPTGDGDRAAGGEGYGSAVHEVSSIAALATGVVYKVVCRSKGGIEIMED